MTEVCLELHNCDNIKELVDLAASYYNSGDIINPEYLNWQYNENPFGKPFMIVTREATKNELVGQYLVIPLEYYVFGNIKKGTLSLNTLTREDFRGRGLFTKMALKTYEECASKEYNFTVGFPNQQSYPGFVRKLDFIHTGDVPLLIKPLKPVKIITNKLVKKAEKHGGDIPISFLPKEDDSYKIDIVSPEEDSEKYNNFWYKYAGNDKITLNKTYNFMKWRYMDIPSRDYHIVKIEKDENILSVVVVRAEHTLGSKTGLLMEFMCLNNYINAGKRLIEYIGQSFKSNKIEMAACLIMNNTIESQILKKSGYYTIPKKILPQPIPYIVRINKAFTHSEELIKIENWKLSFGDYDVF